MLLIHQIATKIKINTLPTFQRKLIRINSRSWSVVVPNAHEDPNSSRYAAVLGHDEGHNIEYDDHNPSKSASCVDAGLGEGDDSVDIQRKIIAGQRVWKPRKETEEHPIISEATIKGIHEKENDHHWIHSVSENAALDMCDSRSEDNLTFQLSKIHDQEMQGSRMQRRQLGLIRSDAAEDIRLLVQNYTAPALACALRDREDLLQYCAGLIKEGKLDDLAEALKPFEETYVRIKRETRHGLDLEKGFAHSNLEMLRRSLMRMPRRVSFAHERRAGVVVPLCNVDGVPCLLFEKRSAKLRAHADEVCLPGGMVNLGDDKSIIETCLREMEEEIGIGPFERGSKTNADKVTVLGILRCNWGEVAQLTGVAVTPVVCFVGNANGNSFLNPNADEVAECFTVPLEKFLDRDQWVYRKDAAPIFTGGPHLIWGLTGYIIDRFVKDVLARYTITWPQ